MTHDRWTRVGAMGVAAAAAVAACGALDKNGSSEPFPGGTIETTVEGVLSAAADTTLTLMGPTENVDVSFKAGSAPDGTKVKVRLVVGVIKQGAQPTTMRVVQVLPKGLALSTRGSLSMSLPPPSGDGVYLRLAAHEDDLKWRLGPEAIDEGAGAKAGEDRFSIQVEGDGLWGVGVIPGSSDGGAGDPGADGGAGADGGSSEGGAVDGAAPDGGAVDGPAGETPDAAGGDAPQG